MHDDPLAPGVQVLEVHWYAADALPVPLPVGRARRGRQLPGDPSRWPWPTSCSPTTAATVPGEPLDPPQVPAEGAYRPRLPHAVAFAEPSNRRLPRACAAAALLRRDPRQAVAQLEL